MSWYQWQWLLHAFRPEKVDIYMYELISMTMTTSRLSARADITSNNTNIYVYITTSHLATRETVISIYINVHMYTYIYIYTYTHIHICIYVFLYDLSCWYRAWEQYIPTQQADLLLQQIKVTNFDMHWIETHVTNSSFNILFC